MTIQPDVPLAPLTTFGIGGNARWFAAARAEADVAEAVAWARERDLPLLVLGGGSNLLVRDAGFPGLVLHIQIEGITHAGDGLLEAGAGVPWDALVDHALGLGLAGIECLAGIPGSVGGTPVQNVGAYGQEVAETIEAVRAFDRQTAAFVELSRPACRFRYRASLFNTDEPGRYIVTRVRLRLRPGGAPTLKYADLQRRFSVPAHTPEEHGLGGPALAKAAPTLQQVSAAVREVRRSKGMLLVPGDPDSRSAGSFFKNPVVGPAVLQRIQASAPGLDVPHWPAGDGLVKLPAAWLLEHAGFVKGYGTGPAGISSRHTLALVNRGRATCADIERLQDEIVAAVAQRFGVVLEREPVLVGAL
jgi:UDP-N-acetylmuramate dehydrogenase